MSLKQIIDKINFIKDKLDIEPVPREEVILNPNNLSIINYSDDEVDGFYHLLDLRLSTTAPVYNSIPLFKITNNKIKGFIESAFVYLFLQINANDDIDPDSIPTTYRYYLTFNVSDDTKASFILPLVLQRSACYSNIAKFEIGDFYNKMTILPKNGPKYLGIDGGLSIYLPFDFATRINPYGTDGSELSYNWKLELYLVLNLFLFKKN